MTNTADKPPIDPAVRDEARTWLLHLFSPQATDEDRERFTRWLNQSDAHRAAFKKAEQAWRDIGLADGVADMARDVAGDGARPDRAAVAPAGRRRVGRRVGLAAAVLVAAVAVVTWRVAIHDPVEVVRHASGVAELKTVELPDGSTVTLGGASEIVTRFSRRRRGADLTRGTAYFQVTADPARVFDVTAARTRVRVVGTAFGVRRGGDSVRVSVTQGRVDVADLADTGTGPDDAVQRLVAGERVVASLDGSIGATTPFDVDADLAWLEGRLVYDGTPLGEVVADVNRYRVKKIVLADPALRDIGITTSFRVDQTDQMLAGLVATQPVIIERLPTRVVLRAKPLADD